MPAAVDQRDWARFQPGPVSGVTLMKAHFHDHAFERHSHETYSIGLTHSGVQAFHCDGALHASLPGDIILFNPDQAHDGQRGAAEGFGYSMLYVDEAVVRACADRDAGLRLPRHFGHALVRDPSAARLFARALDAAGQRCESLRSEELLHELLSALLVRHGESGTRETDARGAANATLSRVRDYLHQAYAQDVTVETLAGIAGLSRVHLTRAFTRHFGIPPHAYLNAVRLRQAQAALLSGVPLAEAAVACGFADQSHFTRRFKGSMGVPPAQWVRQMRAR